MARFGRSFPVPTGVVQTRVVNSIVTIQCSASSTTVTSATAGGYQASPYTQTVLADSPALYLRLNEVSGTIAYDLSGNNNNGAYSGSYIQGAASLLAGDPVAGSVNFSTAAGQVVVADAPSIDITGNAFTVEAWVTMGSTSQNSFAGIVAKEPLTGSAGFQLQLNGAASNVEFVNNAGTALGMSPAMSSVILDTNDHYLVGQFDGTYQYVFLDNIQVAKVAAATPLTSDSSALYIGSLINGFAYGLNAKISDVAIYPTVLSSARLTAHYDIGIGLYQASAATATVTSATAVATKSVVATASSTTATSAIAVATIARQYFLTAINVSISTTGTAIATQVIAASAATTTVTSGTATPSGTNISFTAVTSTVTSGTAVATKSVAAVVSTSVVTTASAVASATQIVSMTASSSTVTSGTATASLKILANAATTTVTSGTATLAGLRTIFCTAATTTVTSATANGVSIDYETASTSVTTSGTARAIMAIAALASSLTTTSATAVASVSISPQAFSTTVTSAVAIPTGSGGNNVSLTTTSMTAVAQVSAIIPDLALPGASGEIITFTRPGVLFLGDVITVAASSITVTSATAVPLVTTSVFAATTTATSGSVLSSIVAIAAQAATTIVTSGTATATVAVNASPTVAASSTTLTSMTATPSLFAQRFTQGFSLTLTSVSAIATAVVSVSAASFTVTTVAPVVSTLTYSVGVVPVVVTTTATVNAAASTVVIAARASSLTTTSVNTVSHLVRFRASASMVIFPSMAVANPSVVIQASASSATVTSMVNVTRPRINISMVAKPTVCTTSGRAKFVLLTIAGPAYSTTITVMRAIPSYTIQATASSLTVTSATVAEPTVSVSYPPPAYTHNYPVRDPQQWAVINQRQRHDQAMLRLGEYAIFLLMWTMQDYLQGLVPRCETCLADPVTAVYEQPGYFKCPDCFGTTFQGGIKAKLIRPSIWTFSEEQQKQDSRGVTDPQTATVQSTSDFRLQDHDYILRGDGSRYQCQGLDGDHLITGFAVPSHTLNVISYTYQVTRENPSSPVYLIPPDQVTLINLLGGYYGRNVPDFSSLEFVKGPIVV